MYMMYKVVLREEKRDKQKVREEQEEEK
jgi:hypothetical protein